MTTPRTELDPRFSEPGARPTSWEDTLQSIKQAEDGFTKQAKGISTSADTAFKGIITDINTAYTGAAKQLQDGINQGCSGLQTNYHGAIDSQEPPAILAQAQTAADAVKPWWQKALAFIAVVTLQFVMFSWPPISGTWV